jgi:aryl-alcohol dehydrogenase-like predicted oxidoreductase
MKLGIGTAQFGLDYGISNSHGKTSPDEVENILRLASAHGVHFLDTAPSYGDSEEILGQVNSSEQILNIITKTPKLSISNNSKDNSKLLTDSFYQSLSRLQKSSIYGLIVHHAEDLIASDGDIIFQELLNLKQSKLVNKIGISVYNAKQIDVILDKYAIDLIQVPINILDQRLLFSGHLDRLKNMGIEIHARSIFMQGLLLMNPNNLPVYFSSIKEHLKDFNYFLTKNKISMLQASLDFIKNVNTIDVAILGVENSQHLQQIIIANQRQKIFSLSDFTKFALTDESILNPSQWRL